MKINTFLIGVQKAGTSTFWNWLTQHPQVYGPEVMKDYHFFTHEEWRTKGIDYLHNFYNNHQNEPIILHGGVNYYFTPSFMDHVQKYQLNGKFIIILRNPVDRVWSAFQYFTKLGLEKRTFEQAIEDELLGRNKVVDSHMYSYLEHSLYARYLRIILEYISSERLLVLQYHELFTNPEVNMRNTFNFLGIDPDFQVNTQVVKNKTGQVRFSILNEIVFSKSGAIGFAKKFIPLQKLLPFTWRIKLGNLVRETNVATINGKLQIKDKDRNFLEDYFREDQEELKKLLTEINK